MCTQPSKSGCVDGKKFIDFWKQMTYFCHDASSRFIYIISKGNLSRPWILPEDLAPLIQDVVDSHPGLAFLKEAAEFHSRYVHTVIARIFYSVNRSWSGKITTSELRRSNLLDVLQLLEEEEDINAIMAYFSYEHFYVIYCKFWELDRDHDLFIDQQDLARHNDHGKIFL
jgi:serine/threonine-protein phosphatase 2A regulatory subunit B''